MFLSMKPNCDYPILKILVAKQVGSWHHKKDQREIYQSYLTSEKRQTIVNMMNESNNQNSKHISFVMHSCR